MVSAVIPHYPLSAEHDGMLKRCVGSLRAQAETLVIVNDGMGFGPACNLGVNLSQHDYIAIINNDTVMSPSPRGFGLSRVWDLVDLCVPDTVTFPTINGIRQEFTGAFLVIPRTVFEGPLGGQVYDERFKVGFWEDVDLWRRLLDAEVKMEQFPFFVDHPSPGFTMRHMPPDTDSKNRALYLEKHGTLPIKNWV